MSIRSRPAAGDFENRAANSISKRRTTDFLCRTGALRLTSPVCFTAPSLTASHFARFPYSASALTHRLRHPKHPKHPDILPRAASSTNRKFDIPIISSRRSRRRKEDCRGTIAAASRRGWSRILTGFPTAVILFKVIFRILPSNRKRQREVRTEVRTEACTTRCCAAKSCATKSRVTK